MFPASSQSVLMILPLGFELYNVSSKHSRRVELMRQQRLSDWMRIGATISATVASDVSSAIESMTLRSSDYKRIPAVIIVVSDTTKNAQYCKISRCP
jgi:ribosomal protein S16